MKPLVIYHGNCFDGFTAAWVFQRLRGDADFHSAKYGDTPPGVKDRTVYILDFSYPREAMFAIAREARVLTVFDHHKTAEEALRGLEEHANVEFDMERSGAGITWDNLVVGKGNGGRPWLVDYVEDRDLWRKSLPDSSFVSAWVAAQPMTFEAWDGMMAAGKEEAIKSGRAVQAYIHQYGTNALAEARWYQIGGHRVPTVNMPYMNCSEHVGRLLLENPGTPFAAGYFRRGDGKWQFSLRSGRSFDVSEVAKKFGGGGHAGAAGFDVDQLPWGNA